MWILHEIPIQKDQNNGSTKIYQKISLANSVPLNNLKPKDVELIKHHTEFRQVSYSIYTCNAFFHLQAICPSSLLFTAQREKNEITFLVLKPIFKLLRKIEVKEIRLFMSLDLRQHRLRRGRQMESSGLSHHQSPLNTETCCSPKWRSSARKWQDHGACLLGACAVWAWQQST